MTFVPRPYQVLLENDIRNGFRQHRRVLAVSPTGSGKTQIFCSICAKVRGKGKSVVLIAHRIEIVEQISAALDRFQVPHGVISPDHRFNPYETTQVAMVQSLQRRMDRLAPPDLLTIDEAHHATAGTYAKVAAAWPKAFVLGVTASPARTDGTGLGKCFDHMVLGPSMKELIERGYLARFRVYAPPQVADLSGVETRAGDYALEQIAAVMDQRSVTGDAEKHYRKYLDGKPAIAFCSSVAHAEHTAEQFRDAGWKAASVDGAMDKTERRRRIAAIGNGGLNVLASCDLISEGTDIPIVSGAIGLRPTKSLVVKMQQDGRVMRPKPDGSMAILLDHVGNTFRFGMPDADREWTLEGKQKTPQAPPVRQCPECFCAFPPCPTCPNCGYAFPVKARVVQKDHAPGELAEVTGATVVPKQQAIKAALKECRTLNDFLKVAHSFGYKAGWGVKMHELYGKSRRAA